MFQFTEDCLIGITEIDEEHKRLFDLINEAEKFLKESGSEKVVGESVRIYDGGEGTARQAKCLLAAKNLCTDQEKGHICFESSAPEKEAYYEALYRKAAHIDSRVKL